MSETKEITATENTEVQKAPEKTPEKELTRNAAYLNHTRNAIDAIIPAVSQSLREAVLFPSLSMNEAQI